MCHKVHFRFMNFGCEKTHDKQFRHCRGVIEMWNQKQSVTVHMIFIKLQIGFKNPYQDFETDF